MTGGAQTGHDPLPFNAGAPVPSFTPAPPSLLLVAVLTLGVTPLAHAGAGASCDAGELLVMGCEVKGKKTLRVCADVDAAKKVTGLQYRFGPATPELQVPAAGMGLAAFHLKEQNLISGTATTLGFVNNDTSYEVFTQDGKDAGGGVVISKGGKVLATVSCTGPTADNWDRLKGVVAVGEATDRPDPLFGKSAADVCNNDALLLLKHRYQDLAAGSFKKVCCVPGALGDDDRCNLDWPSSDVGACADMDVLRNELFALYGYSFSTPLMKTHFEHQAWYVARADFKPDFLPKVAQDNVATLKTMAAKGTGCEKNNPGVAACQAASIGFSKWAFAAAKGQMDGSQQGDVGIVVMENCGMYNYSAAAIACMSAGTSNCASSLTAAQAKELRNGLRGAFPEPLF